MGLIYRKLHYGPPEAGALGFPAHLANGAGSAVVVWSALGGVRDQLGAGRAGGDDILWAEHPDLDGHSISVAHGVKFFASHCALVVYKFLPQLKTAGNFGVGVFAGHGGYASFENFP